MNNNLAELEKQFRKLDKSLGFWKHGYALRSNCRQVFRDIDLAGKRVLEIGCRQGWYGIWASIHGADYVIGLEPLSHGSSYQASVSIILTK